MSERCATGSWPGESQCVNPAYDDVFCWECWMAIADDSRAGCGCEGCAAYFTGLDA